MAAVYGDVSRPMPAARPWVLVNMVASTDGATAVDGVSGSLGGEPDRVVFGAIRAVADVILVASGTVRAEGYHAPRTPDALLVAGPGRRGQAPHPRLAIVSGSLEMDRSSSVFVDARPEARPIVVTSARADPDRRAALARVADVVEAGDAHVDLAGAVAALGARGAAVVLTEGGPSLLGQLAAADLIDELCLTTGAGGGGRRLTPHRLRRVGRRARLRPGPRPGRGRRAVPRLPPTAAADQWCFGAVLLVSRRSSRSKSPASSNSL